MALPYGNFSSKALFIFAKAANEMSKRSGNEVAILANKAGKLALKDLGKSGVYAGRRTVIDIIKAIL